MQPPTLTPLINSTNFFSWGFYVIDSKLTLGQILAERREDSSDQPWRFTQGTIARELNVSQGTVSRYELDPRALRGRTPGELMRIVKTYRFDDKTAGELVSRFYIQWVKEIEGELQELGQAAELQIQNPMKGVDSSKTAPIRKLGTVSAGFVAGGDSTDFMEYIDTDIRYLGNSRAENCFWLDVVGDSMACDDVQKKIPEGSEVLVDGSLLDPSPGKIVVCELEVEGIIMNVLKIYKPGRDFTVLESYNSRQQPIVLNGSIKATVKGVVIGVFRGV